MNLHEKRGQTHPRPLLPWDPPTLNQCKLIKIKNQCGANHAELQATQLFDSSLPIKTYIISNKIKQRRSGKSGDQMQICNLWILQHSGLKITPYQKRVANFTRSKIFLLFWYKNENSKNRNSWPLCISLSSLNVIFCLVDIFVLALRSARAIYV